MINLSLTEEAQLCISNDTPLHFTTFIASSSFDYEDMEAYRRNEYQGDATFLKFPIAYLNITPKGHIYSIGHESHTLQETIVDIVGALEAYKAESKFEVNSIAIIAKRHLNLDDDNPWGNFIFAFGSLELNTYPLPVIAEDSITFIIPFQVSYGSIIEPQLTAPDNLVPWRNFNEHNYKTVTNPEQTHDLWVDLQGMKFRVESTTFPIPVGESAEDEARLDAIEEELAESALYNPAPAPSNSEFASVSLDGDYIEKSTVKVSYITSSATKSSLEAANQSIRSIANSIMSVSLRFSWSFSGGSGWTTDGDIKYKDVISDWDSRDLPLRPFSVTLIPNTQYPTNNTKWFDYGLWYDIIYPNRYQNAPYLRIYADANTVMDGDVYYRLLITYDPLYYNKLPITIEYRNVTLEQAKWDGNRYFYYFYEADAVNWIYPLVYVDDPNNEDVATYGIGMHPDYGSSWTNSSYNSPYTWRVVFCKNSNPALTQDLTIRIKLLY